MTHEFHNLRSSSSHLYHWLHPRRAARSRGAGNGTEGPVPRQDTSLASPCHELRPLARFGPLQLKPAMSGLLHAIPIHTTAQDGVVQSNDIEPAWMGKKKIFSLPLPPLPRCSNSRCYLPAVGQSRFRLCNASPHSSSHDLNIEAKELCLDGNGRRWGQGRSTERYTEAASEGGDGCPCIWQRGEKAGRRQ